MAKGHKGWRQQTVKHLIERDGNDCTACNKPLLTYDQFIALRDKHNYGHVPDPPDDYPTIDHHVPIKHGGTHRSINPKPHVPVM